jgi:adenine phosphoribosyltransferase
MNLDRLAANLVNVGLLFSPCKIALMKGPLAAMDIRSLIRKIPDFPSRGDTYYDLTTLLADGRGFHTVIDLLAARYAPRGIRKFACMEWRGFVIGAALAYRLDAGFVPIRKLGKLPGETISREHEFGHTSEPIEMSVNVISPGEEVVLVDDMLATGAVSEAAAMLIHDLGGKVAECCFIHELAALEGRVRLEKRGLSVFTLWSD